MAVRRGKRQKVGSACGEREETNFNANEEGMERE
jgi:hypothetical protein